MLDLFHLDLPPNADVQQFCTGGQYQTWKKPRGVTMGRFILLGAGSGGGGGFSRVAGSAGGGGGGGGSGGQLTLLLPVLFLPDVLYVMTGVGGAGGAAGGGNGLSGGQTIISLTPFNSGTNNVGTVNGGGSASSGGTAAAGGTAGAGGSSAGIASWIFGGYGFAQAIAGQAGSAGGAQTGAAGANLTVPATGLRLTGGTGGGGTTSANFVGGSLNAAAGTALQDQRPIPGAAGSPDGSSGYVTRGVLGFTSWGGCGGESLNTGPGGNGGAGSYGSGGGGGGAGTTGGAGGCGGDGLVVITCW
jgi:hypothetical protein